MRKYLIMIVTLVMILTLVIGCEKTAEDESLSDEPKDEVVSTPTDVNANIDETTTEESVVEEDNMTIARQYVDLLITGDY
jgi:malate synthase